MDQRYSPQQHSPASEHAVYHTPLARSHSPTVLFTDSQANGRGTAPPLTKRHSDFSAASVDLAPNGHRTPSIRSVREHDSPEQLSKPFAETPTNTTGDRVKSGAEGAVYIRHGFDVQYSKEQLRELNTSFYMYFNDKRHETAGLPREDFSKSPAQDWRMRDRLKTVSAILAVCLNLGVDPPDVIKTNPCARLEAWVDPTATSASSAGNSPINIITRALQAQYEALSMRTRYKQLPDPTNEETKKSCATMRRNAKEERILFHYNGHGVPKPTSSGEIWVFNKNYTQYIPISLYDLQSWLGAPALLVYDCTDAGLIVENFNKFVEKHEIDNSELKRKDPNAQVFRYNDCIQLGACREGESLPTNPQLPADLFTTCLTTPIEMALRFFMMQNPLTNGLSPDDVTRIPGRSSERRSPMGELNWIFTAITDTIAWNCLPRLVFKKLFRQDLMVAALFRNFLLAQRIMRVYRCHPVSSPAIPSCHEHPLWQSWDLAVEMILSQLPDLMAAEQKQIDYTYKHSDFFYEQLTAFEVYLGQDAIDQKEPEQLPIVLQVLLSQVHRLRALILLSKFLDLGPWAVNLALSIGIFPYVLKLLQSQAVELRPVMVFIWARILAVDQGAQIDLIKDNGYQYFVNILNPLTSMPSKEVLEHKAMCAFIIAMFCKDYREGQVATLQSQDNVVDNCLSQILWPQIENPLLRQWSCLCLSQLWKDFPDAKWAGIRNSAPTRLCEVAWDPVPEVRTAMLFALTTFLGIPEITDQIISIEEGIAAHVILMANDGSNLVRKEIVLFLGTFVQRHVTRFQVTAYEQMLEELKGHYEGDAMSAGTVYAVIWKHLLIFAIDPDVHVSQDAKIIVDFVLKSLLKSPLRKSAEPLLHDLLQSKPTSDANPVGQNHLQFSGPPSPSRPLSGKSEGYFSLGMKRTASVAASLRNLAFGLPDERPTTPSTPTHHMNNHRHSKSTSLEPPAPPTSNAAYPKLKSPLPAKVHRRTKSEAADLHLQSSFFDWSVEFFREPQMKQNESDEPGSVDYNERLWRRNRNERILESTQRLKEIAASSRWDTTFGYFDNGVQPMQMSFHQYENHLVVADDRDTIKIWDWSTQRPLNKFSNGNPLGSRITGIRYINEDDQALVMSGSSDGVVKLYKNYESHDTTYIASSFRALTDLVPSTHNAGLVFDWLQGRALVLVAGDAKVIRVWKADAETCINDIPARSGSCVTSLTSEQVEGHLFVAGFGDGAIRLYDQREAPSKARIMQWKEHTAWITNVHFQRGGRRELVSGCRSGQVKLWDVRMKASLKTIQATKDSMRSLSVHEHAPVFAVGSERHTVKTYNMNDGSFLSSAEPYASFLQQSRSAPIAGTAFHPHRMMLACGAVGDRHVSLFSCRDVVKKYTPDGS